MSLLPSDLVLLSLILKIPTCTLCPQFEYAPPRLSPYFTTGIYAFTAFHSFAPDLISVVVYGTTKLFPVEEPYESMESGKKGRGNQEIDVDITNRNSINYNIARQCRPTSYFNSASVAGQATTDNLPRNRPLHSFSRGTLLTHYVIVCRPAALPRNGESVAALAAQLGELLGAAVAGKSGAARPAKAHTARLAACRRGRSTLLARAATVKACLPLFGL
ncbi:hypothetical protein BHM03_00041052 [Ensete ventricosum]|nr:hypothetical protein BHM03_00041052 [Ensete ventricosum]